MHGITSRMAFWVVVYAWVCTFTPGGWHTAAVHAQPSPSPEAYDATRLFQGDTFVRTELFFGSAKPEGEVTEEDFQRFLDEVITPLFPDGLTLLSGLGQFRNAKGDIIQERSWLLILLYPLEDRQDNSVKIEEIRRQYKDDHEQESVLRADRCCERVGF
jgi:hypothetical protein